MHTSLNISTGTKRTVHYVHVVCNIYNYFNEMSIKGGITISFVSCTVKEIGLSQAMVVRIVHDRRQLAEGEQFSAPTKRYRGSQKRQHY